MKKYKVPFGSAVLALTLAACSDSGNPTTPAPTTANPNTIPIAMVASLTGPAQAIGLESVRGAELAVGQINALGGVLGRQLELRVENDASDAAVARTKVEEFEQQGLTVGLGPSTSTAAVALKDLIAADRVLYISPSATSRLLDQVAEAPPPAPPSGEPPSYPVFFRTAATDIFLSAALTQFASSVVPGTSSRRCPSIVLVQQDDAYGQPIADAVLRYYSAVSLRVLSTYKLDANVGNESTLSDVARLVGEKLDATCQVVVAQPEVGGAYMRAFKLYTSQNADKRGAGGWASFVTIGSDGFRQNDFIAAGRVDRADLNELSAGEGSYAVAADTSPPRQEYADFAARFRARFPDQVPGRYGSTAYDAMVLLAAAIQQTATAPRIATDRVQLDLAKIRGALFAVNRGRQRVGPNRLSDMFARLRGGNASIDYEGASGSLNFTNEGHVLSAFGIWRLENSAFVNVGSLGVAELSALPR